MDPAAKTGRQRPPRTLDTEFFWEGARRHRILIQRCSSCGVLRHPPTPSCNACRSLDWAPVESAGRGRVFSYTIVHRPLAPPFDQPYAVAVVELDEGTRLVAGLDVPLDEVRIGMPVSVAWVDDPDVTVPVFVAATSPAEGG